MGSAPLHARIMLTKLCSAGEKAKGIFAEYKKYAWDCYRFQLLGLFFFFNRPFSSTWMALKKVPANSAVPMLLFALKRGGR